MYGQFLHFGCPSFRESMNSVYHVCKQRNTDCVSTQNDDTETQMAGWLAMNVSGNSVTYKHPSVFAKTSEKRVPSFKLQTSCVSKLQGMDYHRALDYSSLQSQ